MCKVAFKGRAFVLLVATKKHCCGFYKYYSTTFRVTVPITIHEIYRTTLRTGQPSARGGQPADIVVYPHAPPSLLLSNALTLSSEPAEERSHPIVIVSSPEHMALASRDCPDHRALLKVLPTLANSTPHPTYSCPNGLIGLIYPHKISRRTKPDRVVCSGTQVLLITHRRTGT